MLRKLVFSVRSALSSALELLICRIAWTIPVDKFGLTKDTGHMLGGMLIVAPAMTCVAMWLVVRIFTFHSMTAFLVVVGISLYLSEIVCIFVVYKASAIARESVYESRWFNFGLNRDASPSKAEEQQERWRQAIRVDQRLKRQLFVQRFSAWIRISGPRK